MKRNGSPSTSFTIHLHTHIYEITLIDLYTLVMKKFYSTMY